MREFTEGFERGDPTETGWAGGATFQRSNSTIHTDSSGNGGGYAMRRSTTSDGNNLGPTFQNGPHREGWCRFYGYLNATGDDFWITMMTGSDEQLTVQYQGSSQTIIIRRGNYLGTILATSVGTFPLLQWHQIEFHYFIDNTAGFCHVYVNDDGTYATPAVSVTGVDTQDDGSVDSTNRIQVRMPGVACRIDDIAVNSVSLSYDTGTVAPPAAGETLTGGTSGATCVVSHVHGDTTSGRVLVHTVSGVFADNEPLTSSGTFVGAVNAPNADYVDGFEPQSQAPGEGFIVYLKPSGNGNTSDLVGTDGDSTDNYLLVDDDPIDATTEGVVTGTDGDYDTYDLETLPASANSINAVAVTCTAFKDGTTINNLVGVVRIGSTDYDSEDAFDGSLSASVGPYSLPFVVDPATGARWTASAVNAMEAGPKMEA